MLGVQVPLSGAFKRAAQIASHPLQMWYVSGHFEVLYEAVSISFVYARHAIVCNQ